MFGRMSCLFGLRSAFDPSTATTKSLPPLSFSKRNHLRSRSINQAQLPESNMELPPRSAAAALDWLPEDLLERILLLQDGSTKLSAVRVCRRLRDAVLATAAAQWAIKAAAGAALRLKEMNEPGGAETFIASLRHLAPRLSEEQRARLEHVTFVNTVDATSLLSLLQLFPEAAVQTPCFKLCSSSGLHRVSPRCLVADQLEALWQHRWRARAQRLLLTTGRTCEGHIAPACACAEFLENRHAVEVRRRRADSAVAGEGWLQTPPWLFFLSLATQALRSARRRSGWRNQAGGAARLDR